MDDKELLDRVESIFEGGVSSAEFIKSGWSNIVICINQSFIFRFNRFESPQFGVEKSFLAHFAPQSRISIPAPKYWGDDFMGYSRIDGERFSPEKFWQLPIQEQNQIIEALGRFLTQLHASKFQHSHLSRYPYGGGDFWNDLWPLVAPHLEPNTAQKAQTFFEGAFSILDSVNRPQCIVHSDLGTNNLLVDFDSAKLTGIIDFSDLALGDPADDFDGFYRHFGKSFVERLLNAYDHPLGEHFWLRVKLRSLRKQFFVVYFAEKFGYQSSIPAILKNIERLANAF